MDRKNNKNDVYIKFKDSAFKYLVR
jgi:hypothetical protein